MPAAEPLNTDPRSDGERLLAGCLAASGDASAVLGLADWLLARHFRVARAGQVQAMFDAFDAFDELGHEAVVAVDDMSMNPANARRSTWTRHWRARPDRAELAAWLAVTLPRAAEEFR